MCQKLTCTGNQYVSSSAGCTNCSITYAGSLTCTALGVTSCTTGYMLVNNVCQTCNNVVGYYLDTTTNSCRDLCGDGVVITSQCDDGNTLNGDGCSSSCTV